MIKTVDLGNYGIKTNEGNYFSSRFTKDNSNNDPSLDEYIKLNGDTYLIGRGTFDNVFSKAKKDYIPNLLYGVCLDLITKNLKGGSFGIKLALGVPVDNLGLKEQFKTDLLDKTFSVEVNKFNFLITFSKIAVVGEGISSYFTLSIEERKKDIMVIDFGGRTVNVVMYKKGKLDKMFTVPVGTINLYDEIKTIENNINGSNYTCDVIEEYIEKGIIGEYSEVKNEFIKNVVNEIKLKADMRLFKVWVTGGGAITLKDNMKAIQEATISKITTMDNPLYSNVLGNYKLACMNWNK